MSCGTRAQDVRPGDPDGARLLRSSLSDQPLAKHETAYCVLLVMRTAQWPVTAPLFGSQPRRPSCVCSGLEPHCRTSRCARPQPTPSPRCCSPTSLLGTANCTCGYCTCVNCGLAHGGPSALRATRSGRQPRRRPATTLASGLHHRTVLRYCNCVLLPGSSCLPGPADLGYERNHNHTTTQCLLRPT